MLGACWPDLQQPSAQTCEGHACCIRKPVKAMLVACMQVLAAAGTPGWPDFQQRIFEAWSSLSGLVELPKMHWCAQELPLS